MARDEVKLSAAESADSPEVHPSGGDGVWLENSGGEIIVFNEELMNKQADLGDATALSIRALLKFDRQSR